MAKKDWMSKLSGLKGAVNDYKDPHDSVIGTPSPSLNFIYGNGWGLPQGFSSIIYGPPKSGKTVITYSMAGQVHQDWDDGWVIKFDTEYRDHGQLTKGMITGYGMDMKRYKCIESNHPSEIYDQIEKEINAWCTDGLPLKLVIIDSMNGVQGVRQETNEGGIMVQQVGDVAKTNKDGLKRVLSVQRKHGFSLVMTSHVGVEMDPIEQKRGNKFKMGASVGVQHHAEYFMFVEPNRNKDGRANLLGEEMVNENFKDLNDKSERTAHKIRCVMKDSSMGPKGRFGEFTWAEGGGIINQYEEIYLLGVNRGVITKDTAHRYTIPGYEMPDVKGELNMVKFVQKDKNAQDFILKELKRQDLNGTSMALDKKDAAAWAAPAVPEEEASAEATG